MAGLSEGGKKNFSVNTCCSQPVSQGSENTEQVVQDECVMIKLDALLYVYIVISTSF